MISPAQSLQEAIDEYYAHPSDANVQRVIRTVPPAVADLRKCRVELQGMMPKKGLSLVTT